MLCEILCYNLPVVKFDLGYWNRGIPLGFSTIDTNKSNFLLKKVSDLTKYRQNVPFCNSDYFLVSFLGLWICLFEFLAAWQKQ